MTNVSVRFTGCTSFGTPATTPGLPAGEIQTSALKGQLGYINKAKHEVGVLLEPATSGGLFAEFEVLGGFATFHVGVGNATQGAFWENNSTPGTPNGDDGVISPIAPIGQMTHTFTQNYRVEEGTFNWNKAEGCHQLSEEECEASTWRNVPSSFEGGQLEVLETSPTTEGGGWEWEPSGQEITNVNTVEGEAEIKG